MQAHTDRRMLAISAKISLQPYGAHDRRSGVYPIMPLQRFTARRDFWNGMPCRGRIELDITDAKACVDRPAMRRAFFMGISGHFQQVTGGPDAVGYTRAKRPESDWQ